MFIDSKVKAKDWKEEACLKFFGIENKITITNKDLADQDSLNKKWIQYQEWKERKDAYEKFRSEYDGFK